MTKTLNEYVSIYKTQLGKGDIQKAYTGLVKYILHLKSYLSKRMGKQFTFGNVSPEYMDYTYFPFFDESLRNKELRFGIVLNHTEIRFELWLMGQNAKIQRKYWDILKATKWNKDQILMPKYSVLEAVLIENPDFNDPDTLSLNIEEKVNHITGEIIQFLKCETK